MLLINRNYKGIDCKYAIVIEKLWYHLRKKEIVCTIFYKNKPTRKKCYEVENKIRERYNLDDRSFYYVLYRSTLSVEEVENTKLQIFKEIQ